MKNFYLLLFLMTIGFNSNLFAQPTVNCSNVINVSLGLDGIAIITPDMVSNGALHPDGVYSVSVDTLTCADVNTFVNYTLSESVTGQSCTGLIQVEDKLAPIPVAQFPVIVTIPAGQSSVTILPDVIDEGSYDNCSGLTLSIDKDTYFSTDIGTTFNVILTATDASGNANQAWTQVTVQGNANSQIFCDTKCHSEPLGDCNSGHTDTDVVELPCDIDLGAISVAQTSDLSPANLISLYNVALADSEPQIVTTDPNLFVASTYSDTYFTQSAIFTKVLREWVLIEWSTNSLMSYTQIITFDGTIGNGFTAFICDTLPNSAPVADCNSGHTLADDVEWPDDITVNDHRITPDELFQVSQIDSADTRPVLGVNAVNYTYSYQDILIGLTPPTLDIRREWTVVPTANTGISFNYDQLINVTLPPNANSTVAVTTHKGRPLEGVDVNGVLTNSQGIAIYAGSDSITASLSDDPFNGVNLIDLILIRDAILGRSKFSVYQNLAADMNGSTDFGANLCENIGTNGVSSLDIVLLWRKITGVDTDTSDLIWEFTEECADQTFVKSNIVAYKKGDVDDSSILTIPPMTTSNIVVEDVLLNQGEQYTIPVGINAAYDFEAFEINLDYDETILQINDVSFEISEGQADALFNWSVEDGKLRLSSMAGSDGYALDASSDQISDVMIEIEVTAVNNGLINESLSISNSKSSYIILPSRTPIYLGAEVINQITSNTINLGENTAIKIGPNPTAGLLNLDTELDLNEAIIDISDMTGKRILTMPFSTQVDISQINKGIYIIQVLDKENQYTQRIIKL